MASGHMNRVKRPDTWLHRPMLQNVKKVLANPEPSTHDPQETFATQLPNTLIRAARWRGNPRSVQGFILRPVQAHH
jgi:hypothetical protein